MLSAYEFTHTYKHNWLAVVSEALTRNRWGHFEKKSNKLKNNWVNYSYTFINIVFEFSRDSCLPASLHQH